MKKAELRNLLFEKAEQYNSPAFIHSDPICVPHRIKNRQDIEISGLFAALLAWGNRTSIINNCNRLMKLMDEAPHEFIKNHSEAERQRFEKWVHRTFQFPDMLYFLEFLQFHYSQPDSLETAFSAGLKTSDKNIENALIHFHTYFFSLPHLQRTEKHLQSPTRKSACKRLNLYLRWMVRHDKNGVDFGLWQSIKPAQLICPLDVHVHRTASSLGLISRAQPDWLCATLLTNKLRSFDAADPVKFDYALFGLGIEKSGKRVSK
jgi:uncharacterized protein (TIGR02757 family)